MILTPRPVMTFIKREKDLIYLNCQNWMLQASVEHILVYLWVVCLYVTRVGVKPKKDSGHFLIR